MLTLLQDLPENVKLGYCLLRRVVSHCVREKGMEDFQVVDLTNNRFNHSFDWKQIS